MCVLDCEKSFWKGCECKMCFTVSVFHSPLHDQLIFLLLTKPARDTEHEGKKKYNYYAIGARDFQEISPIPMIKIYYGNLWSRS